MANIENNNEKTISKRNTKSKGRLKWIKIPLWILAGLVGVLLMIFVAINLPITKNWIAQQAINYLNKDLKTQLAFDKIDINYFGDIKLYGVSAKDHKGNVFLKAKELRADSDWIALAKNTRNIKFKAIDVKELDLKVITYKGDSIANFIHFINLFDDGKPADPNKPPFELRSGISLSNSKVSIINQNSEGDAGKWLDANDVNLKLNHLLVRGSEVSANLQNLSFITDRWGKKHSLKTFSTQFSINKEALALNDLTLKTNHTLLKGQLKFNLNNGSWEDFGNKVKWEMEVEKGSHISGYDISYFVADWDNYKPLNLAGTMEGVLNRFHLKNFILSAEEVVFATPSIKIANILDHSFLIESEKLSTDFTYKKLRETLPKFIAQKMGNAADDFGRLKYNGKLYIDPLRISTKGNLITGVGQAKIDHFVLTDFSNNGTPKFEGIVEVENLNVATITKTEPVGLISGKFNLKGESFDLNTMKLNTNSNIYSIEILDKKLHNIVLDGYLSQKKYNGIIKINDTPARADIDGTIDFSTSRILADLQANIQHLNIHYFTESKESQVVSGKIDGKIAMTNINDLQLDADFKNINFVSKTQKFFIPTTSLKTYLEKGNRTIALNAPNAIQGVISGKYNLSDLSKMVQNGVEKILIGTPSHRFYKGQYFDMDFIIQKDFVNYFEPNIILSNNGMKILGSYKGNNNDLILNTEADYIKYIILTTAEVSEEDIALAKSNPDYKIPEPEVKRDSVVANAVAIRINTTNPEEQIVANIGRIQYQNNVLKNFNLLGKNEGNKTLHLIANVKYGTPIDEEDEKLKNYAVHLKQSVNANNDLVFQFEPTQVNFNKFAWQVDTSQALDHYIIYKKKTGEIIANNLRIYSDDSEIFLNGIFKDSKNFNADIRVQNMEIDKLLALKEGNQIDIKGIANGSMKINMNKENLEPIIDLKISDILMNGKEMGDFVINAQNSQQTNIYDIYAEINSPNVLSDNNLELKGTIDNNSKTPVVDLTTNLKDFNLEFAQEFVKMVFGNFRGKANGEVKISGKINDLNYFGDIKLNDFGLKLLFTGVDYIFDDATISLSRGTALINPVNVKDLRKNSKGNMSGAIYFENISDMAIQLFVNADNLLLLDTQQKDFNLFWGRVYGKGDLYVSGPVSKLDISTPDAMQVLGGSSFTFNSNFTTNVDEFKMLRFLKEDKKKGIVRTEKKEQGVNMNIDFSVNVDKGSIVNVLVGNDMGDISVRGNSEKLRFRMFRSGNIMLNGAYSVDSGTYVSKAILEKTFQIARGSHLVWDGNPMAPQLNIKANYKRTITNVGQYLGVGAIQPVDVILGVNISETLLNPKVDLSISAPDVSSQIQETLASKLSNDDERIIQFGSILMLNSFNIMNASDGFSIDTSGVIESTGYSLLFKQLGSVINTLSREFQIDIDYIKNNENPEFGNRANANMTFMLSPRVKIKTGFGVPLSKTNTQGNADYLSGEGTIEYDWSKANDGSRLWRIYSKPSNIGLVAGITGNANQTYGGGVVYSKNFNSFFRRKNKTETKKDNDTIQRKSTK